MNTRLEEELRGAFADRTAVIAPTTDPYERTMRAVARSRKRRLVTAAVALTVMAGATAVVGVHEQSRVQTMHIGDPDPSPTTQAPLPWDAWPVRGSLAGDGAFLAAVAQHVTTGTSASPADVRILFAGDVATRRVALALIRGSGYDMVVECIGPRGAAVAQLDVLHRKFVDTEAPLAVTLVQEDLHNTALIVLADPRVDRLELSQRVDYAIGGSGTRVWQQLDLTDGLVLVDLPGVSPIAVRLRAYQDNRMVFDSGIRESASQPDGDAWAPMVAAMLAGTSLDGEIADVARAVSVGAELYDVPVDGMTGSLVWLGDVRPDRPEGQPAAVMVLKTTEGSAFQVVVDRWDGWIVRSMRSVPAPTAKRLPAVWMINPQDLAGCQAAVAVPAGGLPVRTAEFVLDGKVIATGAVVDGGFVTLDRCGGHPAVDFEAGVIRMRDAAGKVLAEWREDGSGLSVAP